MSMLGLVNTVINTVQVIIEVSNKRNKVAMAKFRKHHDLSLELPSTLSRLKVQALDCHNHTLIDETLIYISKTTSADMLGNCLKFQL